MPQPSMKSSSSFKGLRTARDFPVDASIVLIGIRGTGKSSLGVLASSSLQRQLVDADQYFFRATGLSRASYRKSHSPSDYRKCEVGVFRRMLIENSTGCVITCGPGCLEEDGCEFLQGYAKSHPVIHVLREPEAIQKYLKITKSDTLAHLLDISEPLYRACSNMDFYNLTESPLPSPSPESESESLEVAGNGLDGRKEGHSNRNLPSTPFLALKDVEIDFLRFLSFLCTGTPHRTATKRPWTSSSFVSPEAGTYTYALVLPLSCLTAGSVDLETIEVGVDAIELIIDVPDSLGDSYLKEYLSPRNISRQLARIRRKTTVPVIFSVQYTSRFLLGKPPSSTSDPNGLYFQILHFGLRLGVEYIAIDADASQEQIRTLLAGKGSTKIIGHLSRDEVGTGGWDGSSRLEEYHRIERLGCDIVRISQPALTMEDNFAMLRFRKQVDSLDYPHPPLITYNTGKVGQTSCCFSPFLTPVTHPTFRASKVPGHATMISAKEAQTALYASFMFDSMHLCVFGGEVFYSLSPAMFNPAAEVCGMPHRWRVHQTTSLGELAVLFEDQAFGGACICSPFKIEVIALLDSLSSHAKAIGAVNTVIPIREISDQGLPKNLSLRAQRNHAGPLKALYGDNTDWIGIRACIRRNLSPANAITRQTTGLVIGAGGMARASIYAMLQLGVSNIFIYNRTYANAIRLAEHYNRQGHIGPLATNGYSKSKLDEQPSPIQSRKHNVHALESLEDPWPDSYRQPTIIVCCIPPYSMVPKPSTPFTLPPQWFQSATGGVVVELAYKCLETPTLQQVWAASNRGWVGIDGLDVLPEQGFAQFEIFTGRSAPRRLMKEEVLRNYVGEEGTSNKRSIETRLGSIRRNS